MSFHYLDLIYFFYFNYFMFCGCCWLKEKLIKTNKLYVSNRRDSAWLHPVKRKTHILETRIILTGLRRRICDSFSVDTWQENAEAEAEIALSGFDSERGTWSYYRSKMKIFFSQIGRCAFTERSRIKL